MYNDKLTPILCALILGLGILGGGYCIGKALFISKKMNRIVTVKGLAEKNVKSDLGIWEINYREVGNDLSQLDQTIQHDQEVVNAFLKQQGFTEQEIGLANFKVEDRLANIYNQTTANGNTQRYVITAGIRVRSSNVDLIQKTVQIVDKLLQQGVSLAFDVSNVNPNPSYYFTKLDQIRPDMFAEATKSALTVAKQFSKDSQTSLQGIQRANQGIFQIMDVDTSTMSSDWNSNQSALGSINKKVRLVTTIDYRIK